ncbi:MAG: DUF1501 domain-containing protein [Verrucomicrobia bacterium]|jgi:uncharacterized protein (DUF1501 family)|nr:DUF1501 domain-containing protein [Verrucomicrobiota bacterium]
MQIFNRRDFLKKQALAFSAIGLNMVTPTLFQRRLQAATLPKERKMIFIFQQGGNDGLNTIIPRGDQDYNASNRPRLYIPENLCLDSGNGFAQFHPSLQPMMEIYNHSSLNGQTGAGNLAVLHRIGYDGQSRSHFDSQHFWQNGIPGDAETEEGMIYRHINANFNLNHPDNAFVAAGLSSNQLVALKGPNMIPNFSRARNFTFPEGNKFLGTLPSGPTASDGKAIMGLYGAVPGQPNKPYRNLVHGAGQALGRTMMVVQDALSVGGYTPENGAVYPNGSFGDKLQEAAMLMKRTPVKIIGLRRGGFDTHQNQGQLNGNHPNLLTELAQGLQALHRDLQSQWEDLIVVTMTEFGRTSKENGSRGTDHAESSVMFVAGGGVKGGVYNCDASTWEDNAMFNARNRYLSRRSDFRAVFGEIFQRHFGDDASMMDQLMPGYSIGQLDNPNDFRFLNFLSA